LSQGGEPAIARQSGARGLSGKSTRVAYESGRLDLPIETTGGTGVGVWSAQAESGIQTVSTSRIEAGQGGVWFIGFGAQYDEVGGYFLPDIGLKCGAFLARSL
jgi:hypothetical protein